MARPAVSPTARGRSPAIEHHIRVGGPGPRFERAREPHAREGVAAASRHGHGRGPGTLASGIQGWDVARGERRRAKPGRSWRPRRFVAKAAVVSRRFLKVPGFHIGYRRLPEISVSRGAHGRFRAVVGRKARVDHGRGKRPLDRLGYCMRRWPRHGAELAFTYQGDSPGENGSSRLPNVSGQRPRSSRIATSPTWQASMPRSPWLEKAWDKLDFRRPRGRVLRQGRT